MLTNHPSGVYWIVISSQSVNFCFTPFHWLVLFVGGRHPEMLRHYFWICNQKLCLEGWGTRWSARDEPRSTICKAQTFPTVLSLELLLHSLGNELLKSAPFVLSLCSTENISALGLIFHCQNSVLLLQHLDNKRHFPALPKIMTHEAPIFSSESTEVNYAPGKHQLYKAAVLLGVCMLGVGREWLVLPNRIQNQCSLFSFMHK